MIPGATRDAIKEQVRSMLLRKLGSIPAPVRSANAFRPLSERDPTGLIKPFHQLLFPEGLLRAWEFERAFSTTLGSSFEVTARLLGETQFEHAQNGLVVEGPVSPAARSAVDDILRDVKRDGMQTAYSRLVEQVVTSYVGTAGNTERIRVDLYLRSHSGDEVFFEMKSPKPNKDQCIGTTEKLLLVHAVKRAGPPRVRTFYAMPFNPYGFDVRDYHHSLATQYLDIGEQTLIGQQFWDFVGGRGAYGEVLEIYGEIGEELKTQIRQRFGI